MTDAVSPQEWNRVRYTPELEGHVESWFWRANHPSRPLALWLKSTIFAPRPGSAVAEAWAIFFDGERDECWASKETTPISLARFPSDTPSIRVATTRFELGDALSSSGELWGRGGAARWELSMRPVDGPLGAPLDLLPTRALIDGPFPRNKAVTPYPALVIDGEFALPDQTYKLDGWYGMQGHNWGASHAEAYAWGQCPFVDGRGELFAVAEAFSAQVKIAGRTTPVVSSLVIRRGEREYRFDRLYDLWRQKTRVDDLRWTLRMKGADGEALLEMEARADLMVCLGYHNPDGRLSYCLNSKLARTRLSVNPADGDGFECVSDNAGAFELLRNAPDARFDRVV